MENFLFYVVELIQSVADGLLFGATYAVIGIGFTLVFGVMNRINMSYAAASLAGAFVGTIAYQYLALPAIVIFALSAVMAGVFGYIVYLACFRFIPEIHPLAMLMATVGMFLFIEEAITHGSDGMPQPYPALFDEVMVEFGPFALRGDLMFIFAVSVLFMILLLVLLYRTRLGLATRAVAQQPVAAQLCGIGIERTNATTFVIAGVLGGVAGAMIGASVGVLSTLLIIPVTVKGLIAAVIGGLGSIPGAIVAGLLVGGFENFVMWLESATGGILGGVTQRDGWVMVLLFAFLVLRPAGIFGRGVVRD